MATTDEQRAQLEAVLFIHGEPLSFKKIGGMLNLELADVKQLVNDLRDTLANSPERGLGLLTDGEKAQMVTKAQYAPLLEAFVKEQLTQELTPATLETLSIITYLGPISRTRIEYLRGVNSTFTLRSLLIRGLIERVPDPERSSSFVYQPSFDLLKHLGVHHQDELPEREKFQNFFTQSSQPAAQE